MTRRYLLTTAIAWIIATVATVGFGQEPNQRSCNGKYKGFKRPTQQELALIIQNHTEWLDSLGGEQDPKRANLCEANLREMDLRNIRLSGADLDGADLSGANLIGAILSAAQSDEEVKDNEGKPFLRELRRTKWIRTDLNSADLRGCVMRGAALDGADLSGADLSELNEQSVGREKEEEDVLAIGVNMRLCNLTGASLVGADLRGANLHWTILSSVLFEPKSLPTIDGIGSAIGLSELWYKENANPMVALREELKSAGLRKEERAVTFAIKHNERVKSGWAESAFNFVLFELTCKYGMEPGRPLEILVVLALIFSLVYMIALNGRRKSSIWAIWPPDSTFRESERPVRVPDRLADFRRGEWRPFTWLKKWLRLWLIGAYFSLLSAFQIGWRELNFGNWLSRMQPREFVLRPTGWVRVISGVQALLSVYLLALWALTYFGRPFE